MLSEAKENTDYLYILPLAGGLAYTASNTIVYVNEAMKYYNQMEVMPVYSTTLMITAMCVGMACFNEVRFYSYNQLAGITAAIAVCMCGICFLL